MFCGFINFLHRPVYRIGVIALFNWYPTHCVSDHWARLDRKIYINPTSHRPVCIKLDLTSELISYVWFTSERVVNNVVTWIPEPILITVCQITNNGCYRSNCLKVNTTKKYDWSEKGQNLRRTGETGVCMHVWFFFSVYSDEITGRGGGFV